MAEVQRVKRPLWHRNRDEVVEEKTVVDRDNVVVADDNRSANVVSRAIWLVAGVILLLLAFRFLLSLLGANTTNSFANFIYDTSNPFVSPFFGLFNYNNIDYGIARFEIYTLVAMLVYAAIAWVLASAANLGRR